MYQLCSRRRRSSTTTDSLQPDRCLGRSCRFRQPRRFRLSRPFRSKSYGSRSSRPRHPWCCRNQSSLISTALAPTFSPHSPGIQSQSRSPPMGPLIGFTHRCFTSSSPVIVSATDRAGLPAPRPTGTVGAEHAHRELARPDKSLDHDSSADRLGDQHRSRDYSVGLRWQRANRLSAVCPRRACDGRAMMSRRMIASRPHYASGP